MRQCMLLLPKLRFMHSMLPRLHIISRSMHHLLSIRLHLIHHQLHCHLHSKATTITKVIISSHIPLILSIPIPFHNIWLDVYWGWSYIETSEQKHIHDRACLQYFWNIGDFSGLVCALQILFRILELPNSHCIHAHSWTGNFNFSQFYCLYRTVLSVLV